MYTDHVLTCLFFHLIVLVLIVRTFRLRFGGDGGDGEEKKKKGSHSSRDTPCTHLFLLWLARSISLKQSKKKKKRND